MKLSMSILIKNILTNNYLHLKKKLHKQILSTRKKSIRVHTNNWQLQTIPTIKSLQFSTSLAPLVFFLGLANRHPWMSHINQVIDSTDRFSRRSKARPSSHSGLMHISYLLDIRVNSCRAFDNRMNERCVVVYSVNSNNFILQLESAFLKFLLHKSLIKTFIFYTGGLFDAVPFSEDDYK